MAAWAARAAIGSRRLRQLPHSPRVIRNSRRVSRLAHEDSVQAVAFSRDGKWVATGSLDKTARVTEAVTGRELVRHRMNGHVGDVSFAGTSSELWVAVQILDSESEFSQIGIAPGILIRDACGRLPRNLNQEEWERYLPGERCQVACPNLPNMCRDIKWGERPDRSPETYLEPRSAPQVG